MANIDYYLGMISPWSYLAGDRLEKIAARHGTTVTYKPLDLMQLFDRTGGARPADRHPSRNEYRNQEIPRWAEFLNMPMKMKPAFFPTNMAPSSYAVIAAQQAGGGNIAGLVQGFLHACWVEDRNIADDDVIRDMLTTHGFDPQLADSGLLTGADTYSRNLEEAVQSGAFGSPFYIVRDTDQRFFGQDRLDLLDRHLASL
jgi:2-hydroxychromene-2-carboxylate isomerase